MTDCHLWLYTRNLCVCVCVCVSLFWVGGSSQKSTRILINLCRSTLSPYHWHLVVVNRFFGDGQGPLLHLPPEQGNVGGTPLGDRLHTCSYLKLGSQISVLWNALCLSILSLSLSFSPSLAFSLSLSISEMMFRNVQTHPVWTLAMQLWTCISKSQRDSFLKWFFHVFPE